MRNPAFVCILIGLTGVAYSQEALPGGEAKEGLGQGVATRDGLFLSADQRVDHLLKAAQHLEAVGHLDEARKLRQEAEKEKDSLVAQVKDLQEQIRRLQKQICSVPQVLVEIRLMELSRTRLRKLGFDLSQLRDGKHTKVVTEDVGKMFEARVVEDDSPLLTAVEAMRQDRLLRVLAAPKLVVVSGRPAYFHVGGEIPVSIDRTGGSETIQYGKYGTEVNLLATVMDDEKIRLEVRPRVSEIDMDSSVRIGNNTFPGLRVRAMDMGVELRSGQTVVVGGLVETCPTVPRVGTGETGRTPSAKAVDARTGREIEEIELLVLITPRIVGPDQVRQASKSKTRPR